MDDINSPYPTIFEATVFSGVKYDTLNKYTDSGHYNIEIWDLNDDSVDLSSVKPYLWSPYGVYQILCNGLARALKLGYSMYNGNAVCSELVVRWGQGSRNREIFLKLDPDYASPEDVYRLLLSSPNFRLVRSLS
jgi:hypothetical protein